MPFTAIYNFPSSRYQGLRVLRIQAVRGEILRVLDPVALIFRDNRLFRGTFLVRLSGT